MTDELTDRSLDGRGDERGRCPSNLHVNGEYARCSHDRGHDGSHHSQRLEATWFRDPQMTTHLAPAGPEWEEFKAWKAAKERSEMLVTTDSAVRDLFRYSDSGNEYEGFREMMRELFKLHQAGTIDLSIYDEEDGA